MIKPLLILTLVACIAGCASSSSTASHDGASDTSRMGIDQLGKTPLPIGAKIKGSDSVIFGVGDNWMGRAVLQLPDDVSANYAFFADQFPRQGWTLVTAMRGKRSLLVFTRSDRTATIEMDESATSFLGGITAYITMSPTNNAINPTGTSRTGTGNAGVVTSPIR